MSDHSNILSEINAVITGLPSNLTKKSAIDNLYEVYLLTLILKAADSDYQFWNEEF